MLPSTRRRFVGERRSMEGTSVSAETVHRWMEGAAASLKENRDYLTQLDAAIGDADHGTNMDRGFGAVREKVAELDGPPPGRLLTTARATLAAVAAELGAWAQRLRARGLDEEAEILETNRLMAEDPALVDAAADR